MNHGRIALALALAAPLWLVTSPAESDRDGADADLAADAVAVLERHCAGCHGGAAHGGDADRGGFDHVLDARRLIADGQVVPYAPGESVLLQRVVAGEMPPADATSRPDAGDIDVLRRWIDSGAPPPAVDASAPAERAVITSDDIDRWIAADLEAADASSRRYYRYVGVAHMYNAGAPDAELALARQGVSKLVNSLSSRRAMHVPVAVDDADTVLRIDLRALGWTRGTWDDIVELDPYATVRVTADARATYDATGTFAPYVRADWLAATAARPPLYHRILDIPETVERLQRRLRVDMAGDVTSGAAVRAGFNGSGVSQHNRVIERHAAADGYYWHSFDFANSSGRRNIFDHPVAFDYDGSEIIFSLPNGFQAYMLAGADGGRIDRAPTAIVTDPSRADSTVENGISCMGCHSLGLIRKDDQVRPHVEANRAAFSSRTVDDTLALYRDRAEVAALVASDRERFERALSDAGVTADVEPINYLAAAFEAELDGARVAAELGMTVDELDQALDAATDLRRKLGTVLVAGGSVKREVFVTSFASAVRELEQGTPLADVPRADHLELECRSGSARACYRAGGDFYRGDGVARDDERALRMYVEACKKGLGMGCTAAGLMYTSGRAGRVDDSRAARYFGRACTLGHARGCHRVGYLYLRGRGVSRRLDRAAAYFELGCSGAWAGSCRFLGDMTYYGIGVDRDRSAAVVLYDRGCDLGSARACSHAGYMYYEGVGVARRRDVAARFHGRACDGDAGASCRRLAIQYRWGFGVEPDWIESERLFRRACTLGVDRACLYL